MRVRPETEAACTGCWAPDASPSRPAAPPTGRSPANEEDKVTELEGCGAGRTATKTRPITTTTIPERTSERTAMRERPAMELHIAARPTRPKPAHTTTARPKEMLTAWADAAAMRVADPAIEKDRSRRAGTSKAWVTCIQVNKTASGPSTAPMLAAPPRRSTAKKNQMNAPRALAASNPFSQGTGRDRRT